MISCVVGSEGRVSCVVRCVERDGTFLVLSVPLRGISCLEASPVLEFVVVVLPLQTSLQLCSWCWCCFSIEM